MTRTERNEFNYIRSTLRRSGYIGNSKPGAVLTIRLEASSECKKALHKLYTECDYHPCEISTTAPITHTPYENGARRLHYVHGIETDGIRWERLYTAEQVAAFAAALEDQTTDPTEPTDPKPTTDTDTESDADAENTTSTETAGAASAPSASNTNVKKGVKKAMKNTTTTESIYKRTRTDALPAYGSDNALRTEAREYIATQNAAGKNCSYDKAVALIIRRELRARFPECKWSVTSGGAGWLQKVDITLLSAPYSEEGAILKAILDYAEALYNAFDRDDGDYYADYGAHHDLYGGVSKAWKYEQTEPTPEQIADIEQFAISEGIARRHAEAVARWKYEQQRKEEEKRAAEYEKREKERRETLENGIISISDNPAFITNINAGVSGKECDTAELTESLNRLDPVIRNAAITRTIDLTPAAFDAVCSNFLEDWDAVSGFGGYEIEEEKPGSYSDKFVKFVKCVLLTVEGTPKYVIDPEGFSYCRYVYPLTAESVIFNSVNK